MQTKIYKYIIDEMDSDVNGGTKISAEKNKNSPYHTFYVHNTERITEKIVQKRCCFGF